MSVRDGVMLYLFVRHEGYDRDGNLMSSDGSAFPEAQNKNHNNNKNYASSAFDKKGDVADAGAQTSSSEEDVDYENDAEEKVELVHTHRFIVDFFARYPDEADNLVLHWGMSRKKEGAWGSPDPSFIPSNSQNWPDGLACQTTF